MYRNWGYLFVWREESANNRYVVGYLLGYPATEDACSNIYFECIVGDVLFQLNSTRGRNVPSNIIMRWRELGVEELEREDRGGDHDDGDR